MTLHAFLLKLFETRDSFYGLQSRAKIQSLRGPFIGNALVFSANDLRVIVALSCTSSLESAPLLFQFRCAPPFVSAETLAWNMEEADTCSQAMEETSARSTSAPDKSDSRSTHSQREDGPTDTQLDPGHHQSSARMLPPDVLLNLDLDSTSQASSLSSSPIKRVCYHSSSCSQGFFNQSPCICFCIHHS